MPFDFNDARLLDQLAYDLILSDWPRGLNRARIDAIVNGEPPYSDQEVQENNIAVNVNFLESTKLLHEARTQFANGFLGTGGYFTCRTDMGSRYRRDDYSHTVTHEIGKHLKRSIRYFEGYRAKCGLLSLHGIAPAVWENEDCWCPKPLGVEDVLLPSGTLLGFDNLPYFILRRQFTAIELKKLTDKAKRDPGWNLPLVHNVVEWADREATQMRNTQWPELWSPEKQVERVKSDGGCYIGDAVPTVDCFDCYLYSEGDKETGWVRRIILDTWGSPGANGSGGYTMSRRKDMRTGKGVDLGKVGETDFLFTSKERKVGRSWQNMVSFNFADLSAVAPFRYHSVRSLGFLLYAICHLQNRMRGKFTEAVMEALMMYFRVKSMDDVQRALKLDLINRGFIDESISPVPANERYQINADLVELGLKENAGIIADSGAAFAPRRNAQDKQEKTRFQVMAEVNADTALIGAALAQAYQYQNFEDREVVRRFMRKESRDADVMAFRDACIRQGVPQKILVPEAWEVEHERVSGGGNKVMELTIAQQLMEWRPLFNPEAQNQVLRDSVRTITNDPAKANALVPRQPHISDSIHDTELVFSALMAGTEVTPKPGLNSAEVVGTVLRLMAQRIKRIMQSGGVGTPQDVLGLVNAEKYAGAFLGMLEQDKTAKPLVKKLGDALGKLMNEVKGMAQRQQESAKKAGQQNGQAGGGMDPKDRAKIQATLATAQAKIDIGKQSHAAKTAQRRISFEEKLKQDAAKHRVEQKKGAQKHALDVAAQDLKTAAEIRTNRLKSMSQPTESEE